jgi:hypothetical protein
MLFSLGVILFVGWHLILLVTPLFFGMAGWALASAALGKEYDLGTLGTGGPMALFLGQSGMHQQKYLLLGCFFLVVATVVSIAVPLLDPQDAAAQARKEMAAKHGKDNIVTVEIRGAANREERDLAWKRMQKCANVAIRAANDPSGKLCVVGPVSDPEKLAAMIDFGRVTSVSPRRRFIAIELDQAKFPLRPTAGADEVTQALFQLQNGDHHDKSRALQALSKTSPDKRKADVLSALEPYLKFGGEVDYDMQRNAFITLARWAPKETSLPRLLRELEQAEVFIQRSAITALALLKDERATKAIAGRLREFMTREAAVNGLKTVGPSAEPIILEYLKDSDRGVREATCEVLATIGTQRSLAALEQLSTKGPLDQMAANKAIKAISAKPRKE